MEPIIQVENLEKTFKIYHDHKGYFGAFRNLLDRKFDLVHAVDKVNFSIQPGELVGYIGPNGAGKSTTIKMLTGLLVPTSGKLQVDGCLPWKQRRSYVKRIGAVFGQRTTLWWDLPLTDSFDLLKYMYKIPDEIYQENFGFFRDILDLDAFLKTPVRALSLGQRMRADLCAAMLHNPKIVFLDEPTIGLDVVAKQRIREFIQFINREKRTTILLTTHDLSDVATLCERVLIIDHGRILFDGQLQALLDEFGGSRLLNVEFAEVYPDPSLEYAEIIQLNGTKVVYRFKRGTVTASTLINRLSTEYRIVDLDVRNEPIEDTIRRIYEDQLLYNQSHGEENSSL